MLRNLCRISFYTHANFVTRFSKSFPGSLQRTHFSHSSSFMMSDKKEPQGASPKSVKGGGEVKEESSVIDEKCADGKGSNPSTDKKEAMEKAKEPQGRVTRQEALELEKKRYLEMPVKEKRNLYLCKNKYIMVENIPTWNEYYEGEQARLKGKWKGKKFQTKYTANREINNRVTIWRGDITALEIDAIVNAANNSLLGGGGVDGAIHRAASKLLVKECMPLNGCETGDAKITGGYKLPAKYVIHTVGPVGEKPWALESSYKSCLGLVMQEKLKSVAFPCISTGIYGYPNLKAAQLAMSIVREFLEDEEASKNVESVVFCLFLPKDVDIYETFMQVYFPVDEDESDTKVTPEQDTEDMKSGDAKANDAANDAKDKDILQGTESGLQKASDEKDKSLVASLSDSESKITSDHSTTTSSKEAEDKSVEKELIGQVENDKGSSEGLGQSCEKEKQVIEDSKAQMSAASSGEVKDNGPNGDEGQVKSECKGEGEEKVDLEKSSEGQMGEEKDSPQSKKQAMIITRL